MLNEIKKNLFFTTSVIYLSIFNYSFSELECKFEHHPYLEKSSQSQSNNLLYGKNLAQKNYHSIITTAVVSAEKFMTCILNIAAIVAFLKYVFDISITSKSSNGIYLLMIKNTQRTLFTINFSFFKKEKPITFARKLLTYTGQFITTVGLICSTILSIIHKFFKVVSWMTSPLFVLLGLYLAYLYREKLEKLISLRQNTSAIL